MVSALDWWFKKLKLTGKGEYSKFVIRNLIEVSVHPQSLYANAQQEYQQDNWYSNVPSLVMVSLLRLFHCPPTFPTHCLYLIQQHPKVPSLLTVHLLRLFHPPPTSPTCCMYLIQQHPKFPRHHLYLIQWPPWGYPGLLVVCRLFLALSCLISFPFLS